MAGIGRAGLLEVGFWPRLLLQFEVGVQVDLGGLDADVSEPERDQAGVDAGVQTGSERCSIHVEFVVGVVLVGSYSSGWVDAVAGELGGVAVPVAAGLVDPADGGGGGDLEQVRDHGRWEGRGELGEGGATAGLGVDAEQA